MNKYLFLLAILIMPMQGFCDRFLISNSQNVNKDIQAIESDGGLVKDVKTTRINDREISYTITYNSGEDFRAQDRAAVSLQKFLDERNANTNPIWWQQPQK